MLHPFSNSSKNEAVLLNACMLEGSIARALSLNWRDS